MSYEIIHSPKVIGRLEQLPPGLADAVDLAFLRLAASPVTESQRIVSPPYPPRGQLYHFEATDTQTGEVWFFTVIFRYSQDETTLHIGAITWTERYNSSD